MRERRLLAASDVLALPGIPWLADFLIPQQSLTMLWGPPNIGKSFVTLDLACSVAVGNAWLGRDTEPGRVVYVAGEGVRSFKRRLKAWLLFNQLDEEDLQQLSFVPHPVQLHNGVDAFLKVVTARHPVLIVIDTLASSMLGGDEDGFLGVGPVIQSLLRLRGELEATIAVVHHTGWDRKHERGSSALRASMDTSVEITGEKGWEWDRKRMGRTLICHKQRDGERFRNIDFRLQEVRWEGYQGTPRSSLVPTVL